MAADVDICNAALAMLGDVANVSSINPPDQSAQASHCARFYPIARDALLEMHTWGFATVRVALALAPTNPSSSWQYAYLAPANVLNYLAILDPNAQDDYDVGLQMAGTLPASVQPMVGVYTPQPFQVEADLNDNQIILTNQANAVCRYTAVDTATTDFSPLFVQALIRLVAMHLAGPLIKGAEGRQVAQSMGQEFEIWKGKAIDSDANQRRVKLSYGASFIVNR